MIEVESVTRMFDRTPAVIDLSFTVQPGEILGLVGPNGAGKTTTLRMLVGIIPPTRGGIRICGHSLLDDPLAAKRQVSFMPDEPRLFDYLTVIEHLQFSARMYSTPDAEHYAEELLTELELWDRRRDLPGELSRGMKQKLMIACGLIHHPRVLLFDEPLTGLDPIGIRRMKSTIQKRARDGASILVSSHLLHLVEEICDRILVLNHGRKILHGTLAEIAGGLSELKSDLNLEEIFLRATGYGGEVTETT